MDNKQRRKINLQSLMKEKDVKYNDLKALYGLDGNYVNRLVNNPSAGVGHSYARKICEAFGMPPDYLDRPIESVEQVRSAVYIPVLSFDELPDYLKSGAKGEYQIMPVRRGVSDEAFCLVHEGISMEPDLTAGLNLIVDPTKEPQGGDYVVAIVDKDVMVRLYAKEGRKVLLIPNNSAFETEILKGKDKIIGVVIGHAVYY